VLNNKKNRENGYQKIMREFNFDMNTIKTTNQHNHIKKAYSDIKVYYEEKNKDEDFDMKSEKIRIAQNIKVHPNNIITKLLRKSSKKVACRNLMLNISLRVLEDLEEAIDKLEMRQWILENFNDRDLSKRKFINAQDEVAATSICDDAANKKSAINLRFINGFINIVFGNSLH